MNKRTVDWSWLNLPFEEFNPAQSKVVPYLDKDCNLVVSFQTSAGKTLLSECIFSYELQRNIHNKVIYTTPYKAISGEKIKSWSSYKLFSDCGIVVVNSDESVEIDDLKQNRIILSTNEILDSKIRTGFWNSIVPYVSCLCVDEVHILNSVGRGDKIESSLLRFTTLNPDARIVLLSATMSNYKELAKWLKSLNGKTTYAAYSDWRPVKLNYNFIGYSGKMIPVSVVLDKIKKTLDVGEKIMIFVHSKSIGKMLVKKIKSIGINTCFYHAGLSYNNKKKIARLFGDKWSSLDVLVSTSALGTGVNF